MYDYFGSERFEIPDDDVGHWPNVTEPASASEGKACGDEQA